MSLWILCVLFGTMHLIATLSYGIRIAGARTGRVALCLSLFNILVLVSRSSYTLLTPALSKRVEASLDLSADNTLLADFHWLLWSAAIATFCAIFLIPTFQRFVTQAVERFESKSSMIRLIAFMLSPSGFSALVASAAVPSGRNLSAYSFNARKLPWGIMAMNVAGSALLTAGILSALYAGSLDPEFRMTSSQLSAVVNFGATLLLFIFVDPYLSFLTDKTAAGEATHGELRLQVSAMALSRLGGTILAHVVLVPGATAIATIARWIPA